jgi:hypothetical protein
MTIQELYDGAIEYGYDSLLLVIDYLVHEQKVLKMTDSIDKLTYYYQDCFKNKMNHYLAEYEVKRNGKHQHV